MELRKVHLNCIKIQFEVSSKMPTDREIFVFFRKQVWEPETLMAMFRAPREHCVYVKFQTTDQMKTALLKCPPRDTFNYENGKSTQVSFATASGDFRYIRLFGLPVEIEDKHVVDVLSKFGKVHHTIRERYGTDTGFPILNGVRGAQMEVAKVIPSQLYIQHFQVRVAYEGMPNRCYVCDSTTHVKADCPKRVTVTKEADSRTKSYAEALGGNLTDQVPSGSGIQAPVEVTAPDNSSSTKETPEEVQAEKNQNALGFEELAFGVSGEIDLPPKKPDEDENIVDLEDPEWYLAMNKKRNRAETKTAVTGTDSLDPSDSKVLRLLDKQVIRTRAQALIRGKKK